MRKQQTKQKKSEFVKSIWAPIVVAVSLMVVLLIIHYALQQNRHSEMITAPSFERPNAEELKIVLRRVFNAHEVSWNESRKSVWRVRVPADLPIPSLHLAVKENIGQVGMQLLFAESRPISGNVILHIGYQDSCFLRIHLERYLEEVREQGKIALLLDDFGDRWDGFMKSFLTLGADLTVSVLPGRKMSKQIALEIQQYGYEVTLHLPMEPLNSPFRKDDYTILTNMPRATIGKIIQRSLDDVPNAMGVNNHMGSKVTSHHQTVTDVMSELKVRDLYFIDSRTINTTVAYDVAKEMGMRCEKRDVFLDSEQDEDAIRYRLWELAQKAKERGYAIGIGHCHRMTLEVLKEEIPKIQAKGYRFVFLSEVVK